MASIIREIVSNFSEFDILKVSELSELTSISTGLYSSLLLYPNKMLSISLDVLIIQALLICAN